MKEDKGQTERDREINRDGCGKDNEMNKEREGQECKKSKGRKCDEEFILFSELGATSDLLALDNLPVVNFWISLILKRLNENNGYDFHYYLLIFEDTFDFKLSCKKDGIFFNK